MVTDTTRNSGGSAAGASTTRFFLSTDRTKSSTDRALSPTRAVPALAAGAESTGSVRVTVPKTLTPGTYYLLACADNGKIVPESDEVNNCSAAGLPVKILGY